MPPKKNKNKSKTVLFYDIIISIYIIDIIIDICRLLISNGQYIKLRKQCLTNDRFVFSTYLLLTSTLIRRT